MRTARVGFEALFSPGALCVQLRINKNTIHIHAVHYERVRELTDTLARPSFCKSSLYREHKFWTGIDSQPSQNLAESFAMDARVNSSSNVTVHDLKVEVYRRSVLPGAQFGVFQTTYTVLLYPHMNDIESCI